MLGLPKRKQLAVFRCLCSCVLLLPDASVLLMPFQVNEEGAVLGRQA